MLIKMGHSCATMQIFTLLVALLLTCHHVGINAEKPEFFVTTDTADETVVMDTTKYINFLVKGPANQADELHLLINSNDLKIANVYNKPIVLKNDLTAKWNKAGNFTLDGIFLGRTEVTLKLQTTDTQIVADDLVINVKVVRPKRVIDTVFTATVATLVSIIYINFGCALNWGEVRATIRRPVGPVIGFIGQFLFMPLISFGLGKLLFPDDPEMQLGLFFTGISPGGGASNVWVAVLNGNINLSITMTTISTFAAFGMMPLWLFTLGGVIFEQANIAVPYRQISTYAIALVVPLLIGYLLQRFCKKVANFFVRILKVFSSLLILFIVIFAIVSNLYLFEIFSWQIVVGGMGLPWLGYMLAFLLAKIFKQSSQMALTIAVETGIQNTGIAIFLLRFALPQPEGDITTVVPVYVATMTPIPLFILFIYQKIRGRYSKSTEKTSLLSEDDRSKKNANADPDLFTLSNTTTNP